jgi:hypothetical protein
MGGGEARLETSWRRLSEVKLHAHYIQDMQDSFTKLYDVLNRSCVLASKEIK